MTVHEDLAEAFLANFQESPDAMYALIDLRNRHIRGEMNEGGIWGTGYADALGSGSTGR